MRRIGSLLLLSAFVTLAVLAGCKKVASGAPGPGAAPAKAAGGAAGGGKAPAGSGLKIAVLPKGTEHVFWLTVKDGADAAAKESGATIEWQGPASETDVTGQIKLVENAIAKKVDAIVIAACDAKALIKPLKDAKDKGIIIVTIDSGIDDDTIPVTYAATDNVLGGKKAAEELTKLVGGSGTVAVIPFIQGAKSSDEREKGFCDEIRANPTLTLLPPLYSQSEVEQGVKVTENLLNANPDIAGIFAANEAGAKGAMRVLEMRKLAGKVKLVGYDAAPDQVQALKAGTIQALIVQDPFKMGYEGVMAAVKAQKGETVEKRIDTGVQVVTPENIDKPEIQKLLTREAK
jgi:ribose transport system substrate-binding protein